MSERGSFTEGPGEDSSLLAISLVDIEPWFSMACFFCGDQKNQLFTFCARVCFTTLFVALAGGSFVALAGASLVALTGASS